MNAQPNRRRHGKTVLSRPALSAAESGLVKKDIARLLAAGTVTAAKPLTEEKIDAALNYERRKGRR